MSSADADMPMEGRVGAAVHFERAMALGDAAQRPDRAAGGGHGRASCLVPKLDGKTRAQQSLGAVVIGYSAAEGEGGLGALRLGGGLTMMNLALDYTFQNLEHFGAVHRFGLRWAVPR